EHVRVRAVRGPRLTGADPSPEPAAPVALVVLVAGRIAVGAVDVLVLPDGQGALHLGVHEAVGPHRAAVRQRTAARKDGREGPDGQDRQARDHRNGRRKRQASWTNPRPNPPPPCPNLEDAATYPSAEKESRFPRSTVPLCRVADEQRPLRDAHELVPAR